MMDKLEFMLVHFEGQATRVWCILHVGNLVVKSRIKQFDIPCNQGSGDQELHDLAEGLGVEDCEMISAISTDPDVDDVDGLVDEISDMESYIKMKHFAPPTSCFQNFIFYNSIMIHLIQYSKDTNFMCVMVQTFEGHKCKYIPDDLCKTMHMTSRDTAYTAQGCGLDLLPVDKM